MIFKSIFLAFIILVLFSCTPKEIKAEQPCIDPDQIKLDVICTLEYAPLCGCDNITYGNLCQAINSGVLNYTDGECPK